MKKKKGLKIFLIVLCIVILVPALVVGGYLLYVVCSYHRIGSKDLTVNNKNVNNTIKTGETLKMTTSNIGFGAYSPNFTFFMDEGINKDGSKVKGKYGKAISKEDVEKNTSGISEVTKQLNSDFYAFQEVDVSSNRAYHVNQKEYLINAFDTYSNTFGNNYESAYLCYPLNDPIGGAISGLLSLSKYDIVSSYRQEYTISTSFSKFFDLDRCFIINKINANNGKQLIFINSHMSAYDEGGKIRNQQIKELHDYMNSEYLKGNYVIAAGDFNHDLLTNNPLYPQYTSANFAYKDIVDQQKPDWLSFMFDENKSCAFDDNYKIYASDSNPSCRDCDVVYTPGFTFVSTVDGFIVSNNVEVNDVYTSKVGTGFEYSDHQPSTLTFTLK